MTLGKHSSQPIWSTAELGAFFVQNRSQFLAHAGRVSRSSAEAEEFVQDALVRVLLACPELESADHALSYFHRVIENLSIDRHRREGRQPRLVVLDETTGDLEARWLSEPDHSEAVAAADDAVIVREAISLLSPAERAALVMWEIEGRSAGDIARELGVKESTVRHTVSRARSRMRKILSERIIDEERGLTALDVLSVTYRKAGGVAQKSASAALSLILLFVAFIGFNSLTPVDLVADEQKAHSQQPRVVTPLPSPSSNVNAGSEEEEGADVASIGDVEPDAATMKLSSRSLSLNISDAGLAELDGEGVPVGFTVIDSFGSAGPLFVGPQNSAVTETGILLSNIVSTKSGSTNVLMNQSVLVDAFGTSYVAQVSVGINGGWRPLKLSFLSFDVDRVASGNYLLKAAMMVDSAMETVVKVPTGTSGTDLSSAPQFIVTWLKLDPTKTKILAQAVLVSANTQEDGA